MSSWHLFSIGKLSYSGMGEHASLLLERCEARYLFVVIGLLFLQAQQELLHLPFNRT